MKKILNILKYLNRATLHSLSEIYKSLKISSIISFVDPYGFVVDSGKSSLIGRDCGEPYTVALDENTMFLQLYSIITSNKLNVESKLLR